MAADTVRKSWQMKRDQDTTGFYTEQLIMEVGTKLLFPEKRDIGTYYCRLLLHDTMLFRWPITLPTLASNKKRC